MAIDGAGSNTPPRIGGRDAPEADRSDGAVRDPREIFRRIRELASAEGSGDVPSVERLREIQSRLESEFYHSPEIAEKVARAILARGDL